MAWRERGYRGVVALSLALTGSLAQAGPYSAMYVFGDSLSDVGNDALISGTAIPLKPVFTAGGSLKAEQAPGASPTARTTSTDWQATWA